MVGRPGKPGNSTFACVTRYKMHGVFPDFVCSLTLACCFHGSAVGSLDKASSTALQIPSAEGSASPSLGGHVVDSTLMHMLIKGTKK